MAYIGQQFPIKLAQSGLLTDDASGNIPPDAAYRATNVQLDNSTISRALGSEIWNSLAPLPSGIVAAYDWWLNQGLQFLIAVTRAGRV